MNVDLLGIVHFDCKQITPGLKNFENTTLGSKIFFERKKQPYPTL